MYCMYASPLMMLFLAGVVDCSANGANFVNDPSLANSVCPVDRRMFEQQTVSMVACMAVTSLIADCEAMCYNKEQHMCYGCEKATGEFQLLEGTVFYSRPKGCNESIPMVAPLPDSQFSASSEYSAYYAAYRARLNDTRCWTTENVPTPREYIQVDFSELRVVTSVITRGDTGYDEWVTSYKVLISKDCSNFTPITNANGTEKIFDGNVDESSEAENVIEPPVVTRCLRIEVVTWQNFISLSLEAMGCLA